MRAAIGARAVRQRLVPDDQVAGVAADRLRAERMQVLLMRVGAGWQVSASRHPSAESRVQA